MKQLIIKLVIPVSIISFVAVTKWWYALPVDAPDTMYSGFPFPYVGDGWGSSMTYQFFLTEFMADFLIYFVLWLLLIMFINAFIKIKIYRPLTWVLWILSTILFTLSIMRFSDKDNNLLVKRDYDMEIMTTGYKFIWDNIQRPDYYKYHPKRK